MTPEQYALYLQVKAKMDSFCKFSRGEKNEKAKA